MPQNDTADSHAKAMVIASFLGDSLALGAHWIYDTRRIQNEFGRVENLLKPADGSFHAGKDKGEFTHYGDQALALLESVSAKNGFDLKDFSSRWRGLFENYRGYFDEATKTTLSNYASGKGVEEAGSPSNDLAGAARIPPLVYLYREDLETLVEAARAQTSMTHRDPITVDCAEFFARVSFDILKGARPVQAMKKTAKDGFKGSPIMDWLNAGFDSIGSETVGTVVRFGQSCHTPEAFPGVAHLIAKYEEDLMEALVQSVMAGGDSAGRGMLVGMILGGWTSEP